VWFKGGVVAGFLGFVVVWVVWKEDWGVGCVCCAVCGCGDWEDCVCAL